MHLRKGGNKKKGPGGLFYTEITHGLPAIWINQNWSVQALVVGAAVEK
jgi:hypothetical protein